MLRLTLFFLRREPLEFALFPSWLTSKLWSWNSYGQQTPKRPLIYASSSHSLVAVSLILLRIHPLTANSRECSPRSYCFLRWFVIVSLERVSSKCMQIFQFTILPLKKKRILGFIVLQKKRKFWDYKKTALKCIEIEMNSQDCRILSCPETFMCCCGIWLLLQKANTVKSI